MITEPPVLASPLAIARPSLGRRHKISLKLLFIAALVLLLQAPLHLVNALQEERRAIRGDTSRVTGREKVLASSATAATPDAFEPYRIVERALKYSPLVLALVFMAFFLFETLVSLRLHAVHYALVGGAMCLFYLALLALGEVWEPAFAYAGAAMASSLLIVSYSGTVLRSWARAGVIAGLLVSVHGVLYVVLRLEAYALLAGTAALFAAMGTVMFFTRNVDWHAQEAAEAVR